MRPFKPKWKTITELVLMAALAVAIIALPRISESNRAGTATKFARSKAALDSATALEASESRQSDLEFIDHAIHEISSWEVNRIEPLLAAATKEGISDGQLQAIASTLEVSLGKLEYYAPPRYYDDTDNTTGALSETDVNVFFVDVVYENANANITFHIVEEDGRDALQLLDMDVEKVPSTELSAL